LTNLKTLLEIADNENGMNIGLAHQLILLDIIDSMYIEAVSVLMTWRLPSLTVSFQCQG
jgi:hypothetical protein